ncbi:TRAP transporter small permease subunit [Thalassococcus sp. BH17M4-6]|uniref:TRAP transporter small permease subunit n=1 Tax=Thalassococcus sp. BH17M4-6 TaxID=3413148 RepID=UPI003BE04D62
MTTPDTILKTMRRLNLGVALLVGVLLVACAVFILADIVLRQLGDSFGGTDEISGYVMAVATSWGMAYALMELAHVRIDFLRTRLPAMGRALMDLFSMLILSAVITLIAWQCWPVLANSLANGSTANTNLETPLAWVQIPWLAGWIWFALTSWITLFAACVLVVTGRLDESEAAIGAFPETELLE